MFSHGARVGMWWRSRTWLIILLVSSDVISGVRCEFTYEALTAVLASINVSYTDPLTKVPSSITAEIGRFADGAVGPAAGLMIMDRTPINGTSKGMGCTPNWAKVPEDEPWVALLVRGGCSDVDKVKYAVAQNASAVLLFGNERENYISKETKFKGNVVVIYLLQRKGNFLAKLFLNEVKVHLSITRGQEVQFRIPSINKTSVLFVSVSFIVLMVVTLAWLIFYYIQRFRYINAKDRLARHLNNAAKKALAKIPVKHLKADDKAIEETESCAVCIELYQQGDTLRSLPCKHEFHKGCVDPWLLEHRTCPMCKMDILKFYGYVPAGSDGTASRTSSVNEADMLETGMSFGSRDHRRNASHGTLQVSVISHSEALSRNNNEVVEGAPSSPVTDLQFPPPVSSQQTLSLGTTTAVIRSMILSTRPHQAGPAGRCNGLPSVHQKSSASSVRRDVSQTVKDVGVGRETLEEEEEEDEDVSRSSSAVDAKSQFSISPSESSISSPAAEVSSVATTTTTATPTEEESSNVDLASSSRPTKHIDPVEEECDIECLVKEIIDLEGDDHRDNASSPKSNSSGVATTSQETSAPPPGTPSSSGEYLFPSSQPKELPKVDTDTQTQLPLPREMNQNSSSKRLSVSYPSPPSEEKEDSRRRSSHGDSASSAGGRRPSSHLVTITHS